MDKFDFSGWATRNDLLCGDGRTIRRDAFRDNDGQTVPLVWNHQHNDPSNVLGHALLENREDGVYAYCKFNDTENGQNAKKMVEHGDVRSLSIYANKLKHIGKDVIHGCIREVSLVLAGANPGAFIEHVMAHSDEGGDSMILNYDENAISIYHSDEPKKEDKKEDTMANASEETVQDVFDTLTEKQKNVVYAIIGQALEGKDADDNIEHAAADDEEDGEETVQDVFDTLSEKQKQVVYAIIGQALEGKDNEDIEHSEGGNDYMKRNVFEGQREEEMGYDVLSHADQGEILKMAKTPGVGSLKHAMDIYAEENGTLVHGFEDITELFPDYKNLGPAAPEMIERDQSWVEYVMNKVHKSPISRIRTRQMDVRGEDLRALGYTKREIAKKESGIMKLLKRTTDPQTVYRKDSLHRDDIIDITDFDVVAYQYNVMQKNLKEELALAFLIGDGRDDADEDKISEDHIRSIWNDEELYTIHQDVDIAKAKEELNGTNTGANFGENYIYAEAIITNALYAREKYKGSGNLDLFCTPHLLNVMLLARDLNGRRIYNSKADLAAALNVNAIHTIEQFEGKTRTTKDGKTKKLLGLFTNLADYQVGSTKGGQITKFEDFDIDFNKYKYLIETRLSGAPTKIMSTIALEEDVTDTSAE